MPYVDGQGNLQYTQEERSAKRVLAEQWNWWTNHGRTFENQFMESLAKPDFEQKLAALGRSRADALATITPAASIANPNTGKAREAWRAAGTTAAMAAPQDSQNIENARIGAIRGLSDTISGTMPNVNAALVSSEGNALSRQLNQAQIDANNSAFTSGLYGSAIGALVGAGGATYRKLGGWNGISNGVSNWRNGLNWDGTMAPENSAIRFGTGSGDLP